MSKSIADMLTEIIAEEEAKKINLSLAERMHMDMVQNAALNPRYTLEIDTASPNTLRINHDPVHRPQHYKAGDVYETIRVIEAWGLNYHLGNTVKYISRAGKKGDIIEDLEKARWYLDREIERLKKQRTAGEVTR